MQPLLIMPAAGAGEIGVPPYFATRLSFPEAVTPWNVEELRQAVINGPHKHPGALAVEDVTGQVISLSRIDEKVRRCFLLCNNTGVIFGVTWVFEFSCQCCCGQKRNLALPAHCRLLNVVPSKLRCLVGCLLLAILQKRESMAKQLLNPSFSAVGATRARGRGGLASGSAVTSGRGKIVHRHLKDGDVMLTNRQPTLHKPGLMAHRWAVHSPGRVRT